MKRHAGLWLAAATILAANGAALRHAAANRAGAGQEAVVLTERELPMQSQDQDDTGVSLGLSWGDILAFRAPDWLDRARLAQLGFDVTGNPADQSAQTRYSSMPSRPVFVALEYDGPAWQRSLADYEARLQSYHSPQIAEQLDRARTTSSRLVPIDAARDAAALRARYPDASRVLITQATVRIALTPRVPGGPSQTLTGYPQPVLPDLHVPLPFSRQFAGIPRSGQPVAAPRYQVRLRFGKYREPWIESVTLRR